MSADSTGSPPPARPRRARSLGAARLTKTSSARDTSRHSVDSTPQDASGIDLRGRATLVALALGSKSQLASVLNVTASQPTRWIDGTESPNGENARALVDLDHVVARARLLWSRDDVVKSWLTGHNAFLGGARPIDVVVVDGTGPVIEALDQEMAGGFA